MRSVVPRAVVALIAAGMYVVGSWLLLSRLVVGGPGPIDKPAPDAPSAFTCSCAQNLLQLDGGATELKLLIVSVEDGPMYHCFLPAYLVSIDEIGIARDDYDGMRHRFDSCYAMTLDQAVSDALEEAPAEPAAIGTE